MCFKLSANAAMASSALRIRQTLRTVTTLHRSLAASSATSASPFSVPIQQSISSMSTSPSPSPSSHAPYLLVHSRTFRASSTLLLSARSTFNNNEEIGPDTILFEGCDYNHWLIVMDFPKDPKPTPEQMIQTYEETCAKGLNISVEEAKKKMYACSTTTYTGFQAVMTEEESEKFQGLPGVIFVLPDSYIDPVNKEYGGDKYTNGVIIPRPPPIQYGRNRGRRDNNRSPPRNPSYNNQGSMQGDGRNYGPSQNYPPQQNPASQNYPPQQNYGPSSQNYPPQRNYGPASQNYPPQQSYGPALQNHPPQQSYGPASQNYPPQQTYGYASQQYQPNSMQQSFGPPGQGENHDSVPTPGLAGTYQAQRGNLSPSYENNINQAGQRNYYPQEQRGFQQGYPNSGQGDWAANNSNYNKSSETGNYGQGVASAGTGGPYGQGHTGYGQNFAGHVENQGFTPREQRNAQGEQGSYTPFPQTGSEQRRY